MCLETYELDPARFLTAAGLAWISGLIRSFNCFNMLLMIEKDIKGSMWMIYMTKACRKFI